MRGDQGTSHDKGNAEVTECCRIYMDRRTGAQAARVRKKVLFAVNKAHDNIGLTNLWGGEEGGHIEKMSGSGNARRSNTDRIAGINTSSGWSVNEGRNAVTKAVMPKS